MASSWEEARRRSRKLEKHLEKKIEDLRSLNANLSHDSGGYDQESASFPNEMKIVNAGNCNSHAPSVVEAPNYSYLFARVFSMTL